MSLRTVLRWTGSVVGAGGTAMCLTLISQSARAVEKVGGTCASGGPYQIAHPCPSGVPGTLTGAIFGGLAFCALFAVCVSPRGRPAVMLAWSGLFLTLGWDFLYYGLHPPGGGTSAGFLVCAVVFALMGGIPLAWTIPALWRGLVASDDDGTTAKSASPLAFGTNVQFTSPSPLAAPTAGATSSPSAWTSPAPAVATGPPAATGTGGSTDVATALEQLATLHARGELTDTEYAEAKRRTLDGTRSS